MIVVVTYASVVHNKTVSETSYMTLRVAHTVLYGMNSLPLSDHATLFVVLCLGDVAPAELPGAGATSTLVGLRAFLGDLGPARLEGAGSSGARAERGETAVMVRPVRGASDMMVGLPTTRMRSARMEK